MSEKESAPSVLSQVLNHPRLLIWSLDDQLRLLTYNPAFSFWMSQVYGVEVHQGDHILQLPQDKYKEDIEFWESQYRKVLQAGESSHFQTSVSMHGKIKAVDVELFPTGTDGQAGGIVCYARNITEEENAKAEIEQKLLKTNRRLQNMLEFTQDMIFSLDLDFRYTGFNQKHHQTMRELFEGQVHNGASIFDCVPSYAKSLAPHIEQVFEKRNFYHEEFSYGKGITRCYFDTSLHPIFNESGALEGVSVFVRDTTIRRKAEQQAQKGIRLFSSINKNINEAIFRSAPDGRIKYINQAFLGIFQASSRAQVLATKSYELYRYPSERDNVIDVLEKEGRITNWEVEFKRLDGSAFTGLLSCTRATSEQGEVYLDGAIRDITDLKQAKVALEESNRELRSTNSALDQFVYTASHDLKAPLGSISGLLKIFRMDKDESRREQYIDKIEQSVTKLENFISDIVAYSRNSRQELKLEEIDLRQIIQDLIEELRYMPNADRVEIEQKAQGPIALYTDKSRLEAILKNLLSNAIAYADLDKDQPKVVIEVQEARQYLKIIVSDNGLGIEKEHLHKIFDMFYRASEGGDGSGIGLFIVKEAIDKIGGQIQVESTPQEGTSFYISIPVKP